MTDAAQTHKLSKQWLNDAERVVVLTGAGISTDSGIPDFRGPQGVWTKDPDAEKLSDIRHYLADPAIRKKAWLDSIHLFGRPGQVLVTTLSPDLNNSVSSIH